MTDWGKVYPPPWRIEGGTIIVAANNRRVLSIWQDGPDTNSVLQAICDAMNALHDLSHAKGPAYVLEIPDAREQRRFELFGKILQGVVMNATLLNLSKTDQLPAVTEVALWAWKMVDAALEAFEGQGEKDAND